jgi:hypothetical protein
MKRLLTVILLAFAAAVVPDVSAQVIAQGRVVVDRARSGGLTLPSRQLLCDAASSSKWTGQSRQWYEVVIPESLGGHGERGVIARSQMQLLPESLEPPGKSLGDDPAPQSTTLPSAPPRSPAESSGQPVARTRSLGLLEPTPLRRVFSP